MTTVQESPNGHKLLPPPSEVERSSGESHQQDELSPANKVSSADELPERCQFTFSDGRQCTMARSDIHPSLCRFHAEREDQLFGSPAPGGKVVGAALDLPELHSACRDLTTATGVNRALGQVFRLLAQRRISRQEAATFGYLAQLLLQTVHPARMDVPSEYHERGTSPEVGSDSAPIPSSGESHLPAANVSPPQKGHQQDALFVGDKDELRGVHKGHQELSRVNTGAPLGRAKVYPQDELSRVNKVDSREATEGRTTSTPEPATAVNPSSQPEIPGVACELPPIPQTPIPASTEETFAASKTLPPATRAQ